MAPVFSIAQLLSKNRQRTSYNSLGSVAMFSEASVVLSGTFIFGDTVECDVRIVHSPVRFGSGDQDDHPDVRDDLATPTFYVEYGSTTQRGVFTAGGGGHSSVAAAVAAAETALGGASSMRWLSNPQFQPTPNDVAERNS